jgi:hypothetical protein
MRMLVHVLMIPLPCAVVQGSGFRGQFRMEF